MRTMQSVRTILWKTPVVIGALVVGFMAASQAGWSGAEAFANRGQAGLVTDLLSLVSVAVSYFAVVLVKRTAKPVLWVMLPILLYSAVVLGAWNGFASNFDGGRGEAIKHHYANGYILEHMSDRGRFLSCQDKRIELTEDAKAVCALALTATPGERIPGSEHRCGFLGMFECFDTAQDNMKPKH